MFTLTNEAALKLLMKRVKIWKSNETEIKLFEKMYTKYLENGLFDDGEYSISDVVDNDCINNCSVADKGYFTAEEWEKLVKLYKDGERDISCEDLGFDFVEVADDDENPTSFLMRA